MQYLLIYYDDYIRDRQYDLNLAMFIKDIQKGTLA